MVPAHFAARYGTDSNEKNETRETVKFLLEKMKDPCSKDDKGYTIIHHSISNEEKGVRTSLFEYLVTLNKSKKTWIKKFCM